jgi:hypothetical protein
VRQSEILEAIRNGQAEIRWVALAEGLEVMARPARVGDLLVGVSARTAQQCAEALSTPEWVVSLTTPKVEDLLYEHAALRPEPCLLSPKSLNIASDAAVARHSEVMLERMKGVSEGALVACGKSWVLSNGLLAHPGRAANYGMYSTQAPYRSATGAYRLWQPLGFAHNWDHWDYSQVLRLVRRRPGVSLPSYDSPLSVFGLWGAPGGEVGTHTEPPEPVVSGGPHW